MKTLLIDIETSPNKVLAWGLFNQNLSINHIMEPGKTLCAAYKWLGEPDKKVKFVSSWGTGFASMIGQLHEALEEADTIVTYNGNKFDLPTLNREFLMAGLPPPAPSKSVDLYRAVRRQFKFVSNKLDFVCQQLGLGAKTHHKGLELWVGTERGVKADQKVMETYNKQDVFLLESLYNRLLPWIPGHNKPVYDELVDTKRCPTCGSDHVQHRGYHVTKTTKYRRLQCQDCGSWSRERAAAIKANKNTLIGM